MYLDIQSTGIKKYIIKTTNFYALQLNFFCERNNHFVV